VKNTIHLNQNGIIEIHAVGDQTEATIHAAAQKVKTLIQNLRQNHLPVLIIDDLKQVGHTTSDARRAFAQIARALDFDRAVILGDSTTALRYGNNLMLRAIGRRDIHYFTSRDAALIWLDQSPRINSITPAHP
jgi:hypothetical protein